MTLRYKTIFNLNVLHTHTLFILNVMFGYGRHDTINIYKPVFFF